VFGKLYNFQAVEDTSGLCPCNWHVPTATEFAVLLNYLGGYIEAMRELKSTGTIEGGDGLWVNNGEEGFNRSGFNALPAGYALYDEFFGRDSITGFWVTPNTGVGSKVYIISSNSYVNEQAYADPLLKEAYYYSVRCIRNL